MSSDLLGAVADVVASRVLALLEPALADAGLARGVHPASAERLVKGKELARHLSVSPAQVTRLRREGMPSVRIGSDARYDIGECLGWLRARELGQ
jgi:hypothetical protein